MINNGEERFMSAHETFDPDTYIVIGCVFPVGDVDQLSQAYVLERLDPFTCLNQEYPSLPPVDIQEISNVSVWHSFYLSPVLFGKREPPITKLKKTKKNYKEIFNISPLFCVLCMNYSVNNT